MVLVLLAEIVHEPEVFSFVIGILESKERSIDLKRFIFLNILRRPFDSPYKYDPVPRLPQPSVHAALETSCEYISKHRDQNLHPPMNAIHSLCFSPYALEWMESHVGNEEWLARFAFRHDSFVPSTVDDADRALRGGPIRSARWSRAPAAGRDREVYRQSQDGPPAQPVCGDTAPGAADPVRGSPHDALCFALRTRLTLALGQPAANAYARVILGNAHQRAARIPDDRYVDRTEAASQQS